MTSVVETEAELETSWLPHSFVLVLGQVAQQLQIGLSKVKGQPNAH